MAADDLDILVLGRQANVRYVTGAPQLWVAGTRPFGPICVVIRATGEIHLNSTWDEGIPDEIGHDHLYGLAWNPMTLIEVLKGSTARRPPPGRNRCAVTDFRAAAADGVSQRRTRRCGARHAAARRIKTSDEIAALRGALRVAEDALAAAVAEFAPGISEQSLAGVLLEADGRGRRQHTRHPGRRVDDIHGASVAAGTQRREGGRR